MTDAKCQLLVVGDINSSEMRHAFAVHPAADYTFVSSAEAAKRKMADNSAIHAVVVVRDRPGEPADSNHSALRGAAPLTPIVHVVGSWFEGHRPQAAGAHHTSTVYWHQWPNTVTAAHRRLAEGRCPRWAFPPTYGADDCVRSLLIPTSGDAVPRNELVLVVSDDKDAGEAIVQLLTFEGWSAVAVDAADIPNTAGVSAVVWNMSRTEQPARLLRDSLPEQLAGAPQLALLDFPRWQDVRRLVDSGVDAVLSKPFTHDEFLGQLSSLTSRPSAERSAA